MHIAHFGVRAVFQQFVADGLHQVGFTQTRAAVQEKRVVALPRILGNGLGGGGGKAVALTFYQGIECVVARQISLFVTRFFRIALRFRFGFGNGFGFCGRGGRLFAFVRQVFHALRQNIRRCFRNGGLV